MRNRKTYFLDLQTLLMYLNNQSCELTTELKVAGKTARGSIMLKDGRIVYCQLSLQSGVQIKGEQAYRQLEMCNEWQVELEEQKKVFVPLQMSPQPPSAPFLTAPFASNGKPWPPPPLRQKGPFDPSLLQHLPLKQRLILRSVFTMINGQRSIEEIKTLLHMPPGDIDDALTRLRALDLIE